MQQRKFLGRSKKLSKPWIGNKTWEKIKESEKEKLKIEGTRSERLKQRWREEYSVKNNTDAVKRSAREDKRNWLEKRAEAAEKAAEWWEEGAIQHYHVDNWRNAETIGRC